jgi:hypothetical protein
VVWHHTLDAYEFYFGVVKGKESIIAVDNTGKTQVVKYVFPLFFGAKQT